MTAIEGPRRGTVAAAGFLATLAFVAAFAPWLPLRDPDVQPDGLVLRDLPPLSRVEAVVLANGELRRAHEIRDRGREGVEIRRGTTWTHISANALAGARPSRRFEREFYLLGTDGLGRDLTSRVIHGARVSLLIGLVAACMALVLGCTVGLTAGLAGGLVDAVLMRATDLVLAIPRVFLALLLVALHGASLVTTVVVLGGTTWMAAARLVRGEVLSTRERDFVLAARAAGAPAFRIARRHLLPLVAVPVLVEGTLRVGDAILLEAALSFLGLGVPPPTASWGNLIADGRGALLDAWWIATIPGLTIAATVIALAVLGDAARRRLAAPRSGAPRDEHSLISLLAPRRAW